MTYIFEGFFTPADELVRTAALRVWPSATHRVFTREDLTTQGCHARSALLAVATPNQYICARADSELPSDDECREVAESLRTGLSAWSERFPQAVFVFVEAECFGGDCEYWGFVCRGGSVFDRVTLDDLDRPNATETGWLTRLLAPVGITFGNRESFAPFWREAFP